MLLFLLGFICGVVCVLFIAYLVVFNVFGEVVTLPRSTEQFQPLRIPLELKKFLKSGPDGGSEWESCFALSLLLHFLYQEHKDTRLFRRWVHKRLQLELNDLTTRSAAGRLIQSIQIRDLSFGNQFPVVNSIRVERCKMTEDEEFFEEIAFIIDMDYNGGFQTSIDVGLVLGKSAHLSVKLLRLSGKVRITLTRLPYAHWSAAFTDMPQIDFKVDSQFEGRQLRHLIPFIEQQFRKILQRKHVWPNYKIRYRPLFQNPLLQPSPPMAAFEHVRMSGSGIEVTVLQCTRLNVSLAKPEQTEIYCTVTLDHKPFIHNPQAGSSHSISVLLTFTRHSQMENLGLTFIKTVSELGFRAVKISEVEPNSIAEKCGFKINDILVAVNNVPIRNERQASRLLSGTVGDLLVLVERNLSDYMMDESEAEDVIITSGIDNTEEFVCLGEKQATNNLEINEAIKRSHSATILVSNNSIPISLSNSLISESSHIDPLGLGLSRSLGSNFLSSGDFDSKFRLEIPEERIRRKSSSASKLKDSTNEPKTPIVRVESARVPKVSIFAPTNDLRRTRSDSEVFMMDEATNNDDNAVFMDASETPQEEQLPEKSSSETPEAETSTPENEMTPGGEKPDVNADDKLENPDAASISTSSSKTYSRRAQIKARANEMASKISAGRAKVNELLWKRHGKDGSPSKDGMPVELAVEADNASDISDEEIQSDSITSPTSSTSGSKVQTSTDEVLVADKGKKRRIPSFRRKKTDNDEISRKSKDSTKEKDSPDSPPIILSKSTKSVPLAPNILWGQSLHFQLDKKSTRYLNVTVHARAPLDRLDTISIQDHEDRKPILLGSTSIYIPQIIDDCQLTLSNCHREVFPLRPPNTGDSLDRSDLLELSRHAGFDARLCFGDITLGFRFFPNGLPISTLMQDDDYFLNTETASTDLNKSKSSASVSTGANSEDFQDRQKTDAAKFSHKWTPFHLKYGYAHCGLCKGKIWLKSASRCTECHFVCHNKCSEKVNAQIECYPVPDEDEKFEVLDKSDLHAEPSFIEDTVPVHIISSDTTENPTVFSTAPTSRRRMIANKVHEKISSTWKNVGASRAAKKSHMETDEKDKSNENSPRSSPQKEKRMVFVKDILPKEFLESLEGSPRISELNFEPGNAYNEGVISRAKNLGQQVFGTISDIPTRKQMINNQIDMIQTKINETTAVRRNVAVKSGDEFENMDNRLQALALLMLHYCSGLQDCVDKEDEELLHSNVNR